MTLAAFINRSQQDRESWKYTDLTALLAAPRPPRVVNTNNHIGTGEHPCLVFLNGVFQIKQSRFGSVPSCILMGDLGAGYKLTLGEQTCLVAQPIEMIFASDDNAPAEINIKLTIDIGANGRLTLLKNHLPSSTVTTLECDVHLHERAKFVHGRILSGGAHVALSKIRVNAGAYYNNFTLIRGAQPVRNEIDVQLCGGEAQAALNGVMLLRGSEHADTTTLVTHASPNCASRQIYKTVLADKSRGVFQGKILVAEGAQKTDGYQLSRALLLSDQAEMDAKPELEIYADDVKCSHGSTIGDLDDNALFYLRSRGLPETQARALLIEAFVAEMLEEIQIPEWRDIFRKEIEGWQS